MQISPLAHRGKKTSGLLGRAPQAETSPAIYQERLRKQVGRELHDGPAQRLALAGYVLDRLIQGLADDEAAGADARLARELIDEAVREMRAVIQRLRSTAPPEPAPSATGPLRALVAEWPPAEPNLAVEIDQLSGVRLAPEVEVAVVGIAREALHNARKHAQAQSVRLEVRRDEAGVEVAVIDDGIGCAGEPKPGHFGLDQIRELAEESGGSLTVGPAASSGTSVRARIPVVPSETGRLGPAAGGGRRGAPCDDDGGSRREPDRHAGQANQAGQRTW